MASKDTKAALLEAAKQLIVERGFAGATVRELAAAAGTNVAAINYHFGSRQELLNEAVFDFFLDWKDSAMDVDVDPDAEPLQQFAARARPLVAGIPAARPAFIIGLEAILEGRRSPELHERLVEHYREQRERAARAVAATKRGSEMPPRFLEVFASYVMAIADGLQIQALLEPDAIPTGDELAMFYEALAAAARAAAPPPQ
jgi:AcrR family transcriptional regulator